MSKTPVSTRTLAFIYAVEALIKAHADVPNASFTSHKTAGVQAYIAKIQAHVAKFGKVSEDDVTESQD